MSDNTRKDAFIAFLIQLRDSKRRAPLAALRRGLGRPLGTAIEMYPYVIPFIDGLSGWREDAYFLVAALFALHPAPGGNGSFGKTVARIRSVRTAGHESLEKRFLALLDADTEQLPNVLRQMISLARSAEVPVDWSRLLSDLSAWDHPDRYVQQGWARSYYQEMLGGIEEINQVTDGGIT